MEQGDLPDFDELWDYDRPDETESSFRELLRLSESDEDQTYQLQLLTQIARAEGLQGHFAEAHATLDRVEPSLEAAAPVVWVRYQLERGRVYNSAGEPDQARPLFEAAWQNGRAAGLDGFAIDAAHMLAIVAPSPDEVMAWNLNALELAQRSSDPRARKWLGSLYNNIGWAYHDQGDYERALEIFEMALEWRKSQDQPKPARIALWCVGRALRSLGRVEASLDVQRKLAVELATAGDTDGYNSEEIGECLLALGRAADAQPAFAHAYEELSKDVWFVKNEADRLARLKQLGKVV
jgi:tetratricopeptide (TPR) repeat protein